MGEGRRRTSLKRWEHFSHQADIGVRGFGTSMAEAFEQAALALTAVITDLQTVRAEEVVKITCGDLDQEICFVDWLNAVVYEMAIRKMLFCEYEVHLEGERLKAKAWGEKVNVKRHQPAVEVKGATFTDLLVKQDQNGRWIAQCVVDV